MRLLCQTALRTEIGRKASTIGGGREGERPCRKRSRAEGYQNCWSGMNIGAGTAPAKELPHPKGNQSPGTVIVRVRSRQVWRTLLIESDLIDCDHARAHAYWKIMYRAKPRFIQIAITPPLWKPGARNFQGTCTATLRRAVHDLRVRGPLGAELKNFEILRTPPKKSY